MASDIKSSKKVKLPTGLTEICDAFGRKGSEVYDNPNPIPFTLL